MQCSNARSLVWHLREENRVVSSKLALDILLCGRSRTSGSSFCASLGNLAVSRN